MSNYLFYFIFLHSWIHCRGSCRMQRTLPAGSEYSSWLEIWNRILCFFRRIRIRSKINAFFYVALTIITGYRISWLNGFPIDILTASGTGCKTLLVRINLISDLRIVLNFITGRIPKNWTNIQSYSSSNPDYIRVRIHSIIIRNWPDIWPTDIRRKTYIEFNIQPDTGYKYPTVSYSNPAYIQVRVQGIIIRNWPDIWLTDIRSKTNIEFHIQPDTGSLDKYPTVSYPNPAYIQVLVYIIIIRNWPDICPTDIRRKTEFHIQPYTEYLDKSATWSLSMFWIKSG